MKNETISIKNGILYSKEDGEFTKPNLDNYWTKRLTHTYEGVGLNCKDITKEPRYSYINLCSYLIDYYGFYDSCWHNNLVPSMNFDIGENIECWIGFPNSNNNDNDSEEWNRFSIYYSNDSKYPDEWEEFNSHNECRLDTIEEVLGFLKSNWNLK